MFQDDTIAWMQKEERIKTIIRYIRVDYSEVIGRAESGTVAEKMSGTNFPGRVEET